MAKHTLKISVNTAIVLKYVGQVNSNTTKKFRQHLHNDIVESWQDKYSREEKRDLEDMSRQENLWREGFDEVENYTWEEPKKIMKNVIEEE